MGVRRALRARRTPIFEIFLEFSGIIRLHFFPYNTVEVTLKCAAQNIAEEKTINVVEIMKRISYDVIHFFVHRYYKLRVDIFFLQDGSINYNDY